jgi:hypothetical protein
MASNSFQLNVALVAQLGRIGYQALLCAASIRAFHAAGDVHISICVPNRSPLWQSDPTVGDADLTHAFKRYDCEIVPFDNVDFGSIYPHSNKFYSILSLPPTEPFLFLDSDTILMRPMCSADFDFCSPALRPATVKWPLPGRSQHTIGEIWRSLYEYFDLDPAPYFDAESGDNSPNSYPYYNAGVMYHAQPTFFGQTMLEMAKRLWRERPTAMENQPLKPWLDQIVLPLVLARLGVPRSRKRDPIQKALTHYQFPFFLMIRYQAAIDCFEVLLRDDGLVSVLKHDKGFHYYLSAEGRELVERTHLEFLNSPDRGNYRVFKDMLRSRAPIMR